MKHTFLLAIVFTVFSVSNIHAQEACLNRAWDAYNAGDYTKAIENCDECIKTFGEAARKMQRELNEAGHTANSFPEGGVDEKTKENLQKLGGQRCIHRLLSQGPFRQKALSIYR